VAEKTYEDGLRDGRIQALEDRASDVDAQITQLAEQMNSGFVSLGKRFDVGLANLGDTIRDEFRPTCEAIRGNGDPSSGLIAQFAVMRGTIAFHQWIVYGLLSLLSGGVVKLLFF